MPGGRPAEGKQRPHRELAELAAWFGQALAGAGFASINAFVQRHPFDKNRIYGLANGLRFLPLDSTRAIAVALGHRAEEVDPIWWRAKAAVDRAAAQRDAQRAGIRAWTDLPWPHPALQDILEAQCHAVDVLPYQLLDIEPPPLSTVYVRQQARPQTSTKKQEHHDPRREIADEGRPADEAAIPISAALDRHEHLIITGEPGAGKSTLGQHLALTLSHLWLRITTGDSAPLQEPVIPLRVPARGLTDAQTWSAALLRATQQALGPRLVAEPTVTLFERRAQGVRWLILVDGLDEIVNTESRASVIQALAARCRPNGDYRIIILTRQLTDTELAPLRAQGLAMYTLEPFDRAELQTFAEAWFTVQQTSDPAEDATTFLRQIDDGELRELARNPLLATLAAIAYTLEPGRPLPTGRLGLYERFFEHLVVQDAAGRRTMAELRRLHAGQPARLRSLEWLHQQRVPLLRHLALTRLDSERPLLKAAREWVTDHAKNHATDLQPGWEGDLETILHATGLLVFDGDAERFLHHSFAEFLAAQEHAARTGPDFPDVETWIDRALRPAEREFAMFMFAMWGQRPGHHLGLIFNALLRGHPDRLLLAGRLLARATTATEADNQRVVDRLADLALGSAVIFARGGQYDTASFNNVSVTPPSSVTEVLGQLSRNTYASSRLLAIAQMPGVPMFLRITAMEAYGRVGERDDAVAGLRRLADSSAGIDQVAAAKAILTLAPDDRDSTASLRRVAADPDQTLEARAKAASELNTLGHSADAAASASGILACHPVAGDTLGSVVSTWLAGTTDAATRATLVESLSGQDLTAFQRIRIAEALSESGLQADAARFAGQALAEAAGYGMPLRNVAKLYADHHDVSTDDMWATLPAAPTPEVIAHVARGLAEAGRTGPAVALAKAAITHPVAEGYVIGVAAVAWLAAAGDSATAAVRRCIDESLTTSRVRTHCGPIAYWLAEAGHRDLAIEFGRRALTSVGQQDWPMWHAIQAWLTSAGTSASADIEDAVRSIPILTPMLLARAAEAAALGGAMTLAERFAAEALAGDVVTTYRFTSAARALCLALGPAAGDQLHWAMIEQSFNGLTWISVAEHMCASGAVKQAQRVWSAIMRHPEAALDHIAVAVAGLIQTGCEAVIAETLHTAPPNRVSELAVLAAALCAATPTSEPARRF